MKRLALLPGHRTCCFSEKSPNLYFRYQVKVLKLFAEAGAMLSNRGINAQARIFRKNFERTLQGTVQCYRLRRFGRLHDFLNSLFLLSVRCPNHFFCRSAPTHKGSSVCVFDRPVRFSNLWCAAFLLRS